MTFKELAVCIGHWSDAQQDCDLTVYNETKDEFYPMSGFGFSLEDDVLDKDNPFLIYSEEEL